MPVQALEQVWVHHSHHHRHQGQCEDARHHVDQERQDGDHHGHCYADDGHRKDVRCLQEHCHGSSSTSRR